jgi:hypothetical protein
MVGVLSLIRGRQDSRIVRDVAGPGLDEKDTTDIGISSGSDADTLSIEARNEKEIQEHPTEVTGNAQEGQQKVEAAALVWDKKTVWAIYAW